MDRTPLVSGRPRVTCIAASSPDTPVPAEGGQRPAHALPLGSKADFSDRRAILTSAGPIQGRQVSGSLNNPLAPSSPQGQGAGGKGGTGKVQTCPQRRHLGKGLNHHRGSSGAKPLPSGRGGPGHLKLRLLGSGPASLHGPWAQVSQSPAPAACISGPGWGRGCRMPIPGLHQSLRPWHPWARGPGAGWCLWESTRASGNGRDRLGPSVALPLEKTAMALG